MRYILILLLSGCAAVPFSEPPEMTKFNLTVSAVKQVHEACIKLGAKVKPGVRIGGCATWNTINKTCHIIVPKPAADSYTLHVYGHELMHCVSGNYHE